MPLQPMITGARYMISAGHYLATEAGHAVLQAGGNAVDAGVAAGIALGVVHSDQVSVLGRGADDHLPGRARRGRDDRRASGDGRGRRGSRPSSRSTGARSRSASCARWCPPRPTPGSSPSSATAR